MDLTLVRKPAQYIGTELHSIHKDWDKCAIKAALSYPDLYEIGMSNLGVQILYHIINNQEDCLCERIFAPMPDMELELRTQSTEHRTLESGKTLKEFDLIGFSLGHELTYTNILNILDLGKIPLYAKDRTDKDPLVMAGGPCAFNPEPVAPFFDFFVIGEAEEVILEILEVLRKSKGEKRAQKLGKLAEIHGIYVPLVGNKVKKRIIKDLNTAPFPLKPIVPFISIVHDRAIIEIMRGCKWGCKFCQAGWTSLPVRERNDQQIIESADIILNNTGHDELSLVSLSSSDYSAIESLAKTLGQKYEKERINISLPSMRTNTFSITLANEISRVRSSSITIAPEAGTQHLRDYIGKRMTEEQIFEAITAAFSKGINAIKLYFMIGLPTETDEDLTAIPQLARKILDIGKGYGNRAHVTINLATFVPKPHTPFQWEEQISIEQAIDRQRLIKNNARGRGLEVRWHKAESSFLEGVFTRGDSALAKVIEAAFKLGCRLDAWDEYFKFDLWQQAFFVCQINPNHYLRKRDTKDTLPWDHIDVGVSKEALINAKNKDQI